MSARVAVGLAVSLCLLVVSCGRGENPVAPPIGPQSVADPQVTTKAASNRDNDNDRDKDRDRDKPRVTWSPPTLNVAVERGTVQTAPVTLTVSESIDNASLFVVPELSRFVRVTLSGQSALPAGATVLRLVIAPRASATPGTYEGTVHLLS